MPASEAGHEPDAAVLAGQLQAAHLETEQLKRELALAKADHGRSQPARRVPSPKRVTIAPSTAGSRAEGKKPATGTVHGSGDDDDDDDDDDDSDGAGGGGSSGRGRRPALVADSGEEDDAEEDDVLGDDLFGDDTLSAPGASHGAAMYNGHLLGCEYDVNNPFPRIQGPLRTRTSHYLCRTAGDQLNAEVQDARTPDGRFVLGEGVRRELSTHIPTLSYLHDLGVTFSALEAAVQAGQRAAGREAAVETLAVAADALKACIQQQHAISHFVLQRVDEIEQRALGDKTTAAQFDPFYRPQRVRSEFGTQMLERNAALEHRSLASIGARARARAAAGAPTAPAGRGADGARARRALAAKLHSAAGAKGGAAAAFGAPQEGGAKAEGGKAKGAKAAKGAGRGGGRG
jgi:hypothetical protein